MEKELVRYRCMTDDGSCLDIIEYQHFRIVDMDSGVRQYPGARRLVTENDESVRYIDKMTFEIIDTGELVRRQG
ncbi:hypothetical protein [uncultured Parasphingorhabdus sp.]|uniref:hypothetical protein n=1 Tax=uncultured Parasphingorhabdus sp. TaxID=2709694 RepID=UPI0030DD644A|tara:strand:- start:65117 stop:65338 length:222 start_codon:yes stop_codon:yes gene_type:complete